MSRPRVTEQRLSNGTKVFYKTHPFGGYDVHTNPANKRIGYVFWTVGTWISTVKRPKWDSGPCETRGEAALKLWKHVFKGK